MSAVKSNLPVATSRDSANKTVEFFDNYFTEPVSFKQSEVDTVIGYFEKRNFERSAAIAISTVLLTQAKLDGVKVYKLIDTLKGLTNVQLSALVAEVLNYNRPKTSTLGYKTQPQTDNLEARNIII